jgi:hypothetical protein
MVRVGQFFPALRPLPRPTAVETKRHAGFDVPAMRAGAVVLGLAAAGWLWVRSLDGIDPRQMTELGLLSVLPLPFYAALAVLVVSFATAVAQRRVAGSVLFLHVALLVLILHATPVLLYQTIRYAWAWKHVGIVDFIQRYQAIDPYIAVSPAYHNWPGFFALSALLVDLAGLKDVVPIALWAPVFFNLIDVGPLVLILRALTTSERSVWLGVWLYYLTNWVGQDYFAPQALALFLYFTALAICLGWFKPAAPLAAAGHRLRSAWAAGRLARLMRRVARTEPPNAPSSTVQRLGLLAIAVLCLATIVGTHQLTPFMAIGALAALVLLRRCRLRTLPILMVVLTVAWCTYPALPFFSRHMLGSIGGSFGDVLANTTATLIDLSSASEGQVLVALVGRAFTAAVWGLAFLGGLLRLYDGHRDLSAASLAAVPFGMLAINSYDGEMLFRAYLLSLPFVAFFIAMLLRWLALRWGLRVYAGGVGLLSGALLAGFLFPYYGKDLHYYLTDAEIAASAFVYGMAPPGSLLVEGSADYPGKFKNYERFTYVALTDEPPESKAQVLADPAGSLSRWLDNPAYAASYVIITRSQKAGADMLGDLPAGALAAIERALRHSPLFETVYANQDAAVFTLAARNAREGGRR